MKYLKYYKSHPYVSDDEDGAPIKIGSKVRKTNSELGDLTANGALGTVIGSVSIPIKGEWAYAVVWDGMPNVPVGVIGKKLELT